MEEIDKKESEGEGIIYDAVQGKHICVLCPLVEPKISSTVAQKSSNFATEGINWNWIFATSDALFAQLVSPEMRDLLGIDVTKESFYCTICFQDILDIETAITHISGEQHTNSKKIYGCNFIERTRKKNYYCRCCDQGEQELPKIYNHLLSSSHAQRVMKSQRFDCNSSSLRTNEQPKKSEIRTKDAGVLQSFAKTSDQSSSKAKKDGAPESKEENSKIQKKQLNLIIRPRTALYKRLVPKDIRKSLTNETRKEFLYCFVCSECFFKKETADEHLSSEQHSNCMKKHGFDLLVMNETGQYHCTCCDQSAGQSEKLYRHPMTKEHVNRLREYNQRSSQTIDNKNPGNSICKQATTSHELAESVAENLPKTIEPEDPLCSNFCPINAGQSSEPSEFKWKGISSFLETNWIIKVSNEAYKRVVPYHARQECVKIIGRTSFYCLVCLEHLCGIDTASLHNSSEKHTKSMEKYGCHCIKKISRRCYRCSCCEREKHSLAAIYNHLRSDGHVNRSAVVADEPAKSRNVETNDIGDSHSTSEDLQSFSTNSRSSRDDSCDNSAHNETDQEFEFIDTDLTWVVNVLHPSFPPSSIKNLAKEMAKKTKKTYCLICRTFFSRLQTAQRHIASKEHENKLKLFGCNYIEVTKRSKFRCTCCRSSELSFGKISEHVMTVKHIRKIREIVARDRELLSNEEESKSAAAMWDVGYLDSALNWLISPDHSMFKKSYIERYGIPKGNASQRSFYCLICDIPCNGRLMNVDEGRKHIASNLHAVSILQYGCDGVQFGPNHTYHCTFCDCKKMSFSQIVIHVTTSNKHLNEVFMGGEKTGFRWNDQPIEEDSKEEETAKELDSLQADFPWIHRLTDGRAKQFDPKKFDANVANRAENESSAEVRIKNANVKHQNDRKLGPSPINLPPTEETPSQESQSRNWFSKDSLGSQMSLDRQTCPETEKTHENDIFFARDLDWVIDRFHPMFPHRTVHKPHEKLVSHARNHIFHCLVCFVDFPNAQTTKKHISGEQHRNSLVRFGCNLIQVTPQLNYRCGFCQNETKTFFNIYTHVMGDQHTKKVGESRLQTLVPFCAEEKARAPENEDNRVGPSFWDTGAFSFDWPASQEQYTPTYEKLRSSRKSSPDRSDSDDAFSRNFPKINSAPSTRRTARKPLEQNFKLRDEDLNWVVGSSHTLYKAKASKSSRAQSAKNLRGQSFYCLLCFLHFSDIEAAVIHISSEDHANSIKQFGCNFVQVTPDSKFRCACCNREKNHFYKIYNHIVSSAHMDRICEMNQETDDKAPVEFLAEKSSDFETHDNDIDQSFSENSDPCSIGSPTFTEKPFSLNEETSSSLEMSSCIFVTKRNAKKSYCHICESIELPIATKNLENHINSMRHKFSLKRHGCENIESRQDDSYYCACCNYQISNLQNVYLHIKDKKHTSSLIKVKQESKRVKKVTRAVSPANRFKTIGKPLLCEFIVKKICEPDEIVDEDVYEPLEDSRKNLLPRCTSNFAKELEKLNSISEQLDNSNQPLFNSMLVTMVDRLSQLSKQIADCNASTGCDKWTNFQAIENPVVVEPIICKICEASVQSLNDLHSHMAEHISEELVAETVTESCDRLAALSDPEDSESGNPSRDSRRNCSTNKNLDPQSCPKSDESSRSFDDSSSSGSDGELGEFDAEESRPVWDREQYSKDAKKAASSNKIDLKKVMLQLNFKSNYIYELEDKLKDLEMGSRMLLVIDKETIYCLVCRERVKNTLKDYSAHLWSLDHCSCLDLMEKDAAAFYEFPDQFSDLELAHEYMEEISSDTVRCYLCNRDVENETETLRDHIYDDEHERACASTRSNGLAIFETLKCSVKCDWYGIEQYTCLACNMRSPSEVSFVKHLNGRKHAQKMLQSPNVESKMQFDYCPTCAVLWYGYRSSYSYHVNELDVHKWLSKDGFYSSNTIRKSAKTLLQHPEDDVDRLIRHLDEIKPNEKSKEDTLVDDLLRIVRSTFPGAKAYTFGSRVTGLSSEDSDIDIFLDCRNVYNGKGKSDTLFFIDHVFKCLNKHPERWDIQEVLTRCRSPIIRVDHRPTGLACDISFDNGLTVEKTKFIKRIVEVYPTFRKLVLILKMWMGHCNLSGSERISHSSLYWLVIFFLQNEKILPSIAYLISMKSKSHIIAGCEVGVSYDFGYFEADGGTSVTELLQRFFIFYANFDFRFDVVCPLLGEAIRKRDFASPEYLPKEMRTYVKQVTKMGNIEMFRIDSPMCIQDPFDLSHNVTKAARKEVLNQFRTCCLQSVDLMASL